MVSQHILDTIFAAIADPSALTANARSEAIFFPLRMQYDGQAHG
jgi:hypothetical protein